MAIEKDTDALRTVVEEIIGAQGEGAALPKYRDNIAQ
jgi:hypothetical protein